MKGYVYNVNHGDDTFIYVIGDGLNYMHNVSYLARTSVFEALTRDPGLPKRHRVVLRAQRRP